MFCEACTFFVCTLSLNLHLTSHKVYIRRSTSRRFLFVLMRVNTTIKNGMR